MLEMRLTRFVGHRDACLDGLLCRNVNPDNILITMRQTIQGKDGVGSPPAICGGMLLDFDDSKQNPDSVTVRFRPGVVARRPLIRP